MLNSLIVVGVAVSLLLWVLPAVLQGRPGAAVGRLAAVAVLAAAVNWVSG